MLALTTIAQLPTTNQLSDLVKDMTDVETCSECYIELCDKTISLPTTINCEDIDNIITEIEEALFKESKDCEGKMKKYICDVYITPFAKITEDTCENENYGVDLLEESYEESFCKANENCKDLSRCSLYNIDCEYDSDILPFIGESSTPFDESECPHNEFIEKVKTFFEDYWKDIAISGTMDAILLSIIIVMLMCCCRPKKVIIQDRNIV